MSAEARASGPASPRRTFGERLADGLTDTSERASRNALGAAFALLVVTICVVEVAGPVRCNAYAHDVFLVLDGGWRILQGQRPHLDFYSPLGALPSLLCALSLAVGGYKMGSILHEAALMALLLGAWTVALARWRLSAVCGAMATLVVGFVVLGTHPLGFDVRQTDYAMQYNRFGFAMLAMVWLEAFSTPSGPWAQRLGGLSTGALVGLLLFLKLNFFGLAVLVAAVRLATRGDRRRWLAGAMAGFAVACLPLLAYLRFAIGPMLHDFVTVTRARSRTLDLGRVLDVASDNGWWVVLLALLVAAVVALLPPERRSSRVVLSLAGEAVLLAIVGVLAIATNWQWYEAPVFGMGALVLFDRASRRIASVSQGERRALGERVLWAGALAGILAIRVAGRDAWGIASSSLDNAFHPAPFDERFQLGTLSGYVVGTGGGPCGSEYSAKLRDGLALLSGVADDRTRLFVADFTNPFNFALRLHSPRGDATWWHYGNTYTEGSGLGPEVVLHDVNLALVPRKCPEDNHFEEMTRNHIAWLDTHFVRKGYSKYWILLARP